MKNFFRFCFVSLTVAVLASCSSSKEIVYFQDIDDVALSALNTAYEAVIKKDDRLSIIVSGADKVVCAPYNLTLTELGSTSMSSTNPENVVLTYLVDDNGNIDFPSLGKIHVEGMTRNQLVNYLRAEIGKDIKDPIIYVSIKNYKITVLGEVRNPGTFSMDSEKLTILQALGRAGDLNLTAKRDGILLLREENGVVKHYSIDLRKSELLESPFYYLQQNDVIYVPASGVRVANATLANGLVSVITSTLSTAISVTTLGVTLSKLK